MRSGILPFRPVLRDFWRNLWVLRLFLLLIVLMWITCSMAAGWLQQIPSSRGIWVIPLVKIMEGLNSFIHALLFGLLIWVVQQSLGGHALKRSKFLLFPTEEDL